MSTTLELPGWVGDADCERPGPMEKLLIERRDDLVCVAYLEDTEASYEYDEAAIVALDGSVFFYVQTTGCSCPSPSETWRVIHGPMSLDELVLTVFIRHEYQGYTVSGNKLDEMLAHVRRYKEGE